MPRRNTQNTDKIKYSVGEKESSGYPVYVRHAGYPTQTVSHHKTKALAEKKVSQISKKKMAGGGNITSAEIKEKIRKFIIQFPVDAQSWGEATGELADMHGRIAEIYNEGYPKTPYILREENSKTPADHNTYHRWGIHLLLPLLSDAQLKEVYEYYEGWLKKLANGGSVYTEGGDINSTVDNLKKGDTISIEFGSAIRRDNKVTLKVRSRNKVRKGTIDKITFENVNNPGGVKYYAYERGTGKWGFAMGDLGISDVVIVESYADGGPIHPKRGKMFSVNAHQIGSSKYSLDTYDGKATHPDGSPFIGIDLFKFKKDLEKGKKKYISRGYKEVYDVFKELHKYAGGGYVRPPYDLKTTGVYSFKTKDKEYTLNVSMFERDDDDSDLLQIQDELRGELGGIIIKNSAWKRLSKGATITARTSKGDVAGKLTRVKDLYAGGGGIEDSQLDRTLRGYKAAILFAEVDDNEDPLDENYDMDDFSASAEAKMRATVKKFIEDNRDLIAESGLDDDQVGHDLWLTRRGHGAGFWDRGLGDIGDKLTEAAEKNQYESAEVYAEDGVVEVYAKGGAIKTTWGNPLLDTIFNW